MLKNNKMLKINILGTHAAGKSTLSFQIGNLLKKHNINAKIIAENIRACPFPINEKAVIETEVWVFHKAVLSELHAKAEKYDAIILDRGVLDGIVYFLDRNTPNKYYDLLRQMAYQWAEEEYDLFILVEPDDPDQPYLVDEVRDPQIEYRKRIMLLFRDFVKKLNPEARKRMISLKSSEVFDEKGSGLEKIKKAMLNNGYLMAAKEAGEPVSV
ncbi:MAG: AAA family ATPase [Parachlamydiales bacterium]|jgi:nicotinamide riboside kinase